MNDEQFKTDGPTPEDCAAGRHLLMSSYSNPYLLICTECSHSVDLKAERAAYSDKCAEVERLQAKLDWLDNNTAHYITAESDGPVLAAVSRKIWYHATDNIDAYPFSAVIDAALAEQEQP